MTETYRLISSALVGLVLVMAIIMAILAIRVPTASAPDWRTKAESTGHYASRGAYTGAHPDVLGPGSSSRSASLERTLTQSAVVEPEAKIPTDTRQLIRHPRFFWWH